MSKKDSSKKDGNKNKKRDKPDEKEWCWDDTALADPDNTSLLAQDVKTLLLTRGEPKQNLKGKKAELIGFLKEKYDVALEKDFDELKVVELKAELRLRKLDDSNAQKTILIQRLKGEIDATAPPPKKAKKGRKPKNVVYVTLYTPAVSEEDTSTQALGVFKSRRKAFEKAQRRLMSDLEKKYEDKKSKLEKAKKEIEKIKDEDYEGKLNAISDAINKAYGKADDAPYCEIDESTMTN